MKCKICTHPKRLEIDRLIVQGVQHTKIAKQYGMSNQSVRNHSMNHLSRQLLKYDETRERISSSRILDEVEDLLTKTKRILRDSEADDQRQTSLSAVRELRATLEFLSRLAITLAELQKEERVNDTHQEDQARAERIKKLPTCELNLLGDLQGKIDGEIPFTKRLLPKEFYTDDDLHITIDIPKSKLPEGAEDTVINVRTDDDGGTQSFTPSEVLEGLEGIEPVEPISSLIDDEPKSESSTQTMTRRRPAGNVYYGPSMSQKAAYREARRYIKAYGKWPSEPFLREALERGGYK